MKKILSVLVSVLVLSGCNNDEKAQPKSYSLKCGSYDVFVEVIGSDKLNTAINGEKIQMLITRSASGALYTGKGAVVSASVWNKGQNWQVSIDKGGFIACMVVKKK